MITITNTTTKKSTVTTTRDIIVTTPKSAIEAAAQEAAQCIKNKGGSYFRRFQLAPKTLQKDSKIFYVEDGYIRGYAVVSEIQQGPQLCSTTGKQWPNGTYAIMSADTWKWIKPIAMKGFQGWRYFDSSQVEVVGGWLDLKPS